MVEGFFALFLFMITALRINGTELEIGIDTVLKAVVWSQSALSPLGRCFRVLSVGIRIRRLGTT